MIVGPVAWEWVALVVALAVCGTVAVAWLAVGGIRQARAWWRDWQMDRHGSIEDGIMCRPCEEHRHAECERYRDLPGPSWCICKSAAHYDRQLGWGAAEFDLPPERSQEDLGFTGPRSLMGPAERAFWSELEEFGPHGMLRPERERRAPWWEAEHRAAYESLGLDYPSGLMARVRELAP